MISDMDSRNLPNPVTALVSWLAGCFLGLAVLAPYASGLSTVFGFIILVLAAIMLLAALLTRHALPLAMTLLLAGLGRTLLTHPPSGPQDIAFYVSQEGAVYSLTGEVAAEPVFADRFQRLRVAVNSLVPVGAKSAKPVGGTLIVVTARYPEYSQGEHLSLSGKLISPPRQSDFNYAAYLARQDVFAYMSYPKVSRVAPDAHQHGLRGLIAAARTHARAAIRASMPEPEASLAVGVVTGDRTSMPEELTGAFARSGTSHVLAISGENITLLVGAIWLIFGGRKSRRRMPATVLAATLSVLVLYTLFTGATPSILRATLMSTILLLAPWFGRRYDVIAALAWSAFGMTLWDPRVVGDAGFQLSFASMLGLALISPVFHKRLVDWRMPALLSAPVSAGLGAQVVTLPLILLLGGQASIVAPLATITIDFTLLPLMIGGIAVAVLGNLLPVLGAAMGTATWIFGAWMIWWVRLWSALPWAAFQGASVSTVSIIVYYLCLGSLVWAHRYSASPARANRQELAPPVVAWLSIWALLVTVLLVR